jgi:alpha-glucosidase
MTKGSWWRGAVIYQVYPRSLLDTNSDGIGDIQGIVQKIDYIASLGVDAIWVSPFFKSPMKDFGYDISDYRKIDPIFGTLDDFDRLIKTAHQAGLKVIIDQVLSHTSDQHEWFTQSRQSTSNTMSDWYVWADAQADGGPPNNWLSIFGGSAWQWDADRGQYYLHNFLASQPDLNYHNPEVRRQILEEVEFWLKRGVDGLRLDAINFCFHDKQLRDNPAKPAHKRKGRGFSESNPYAYQYHYYDNTQEENLGFLEDLRLLLDGYPATIALGEISSEDSLATMGQYTQGEKRLHAAYSFELLTDDFSAQYVHDTVVALEQRIKGGWPCWAVGNHDVERVLSRWGGEGATAALAKMITAMLCSLKGSVCTYQGEELGLTEVSVSKEQLQDPYGIAFWPNFKGRDGCRTPMPWTEQDNGGFSTVAPWLPVAPEHLALSVETQWSDADSVLNAYRQFIHWRKCRLELLYGEIDLLPVVNNVLMFVRVFEGEKTLACFNFNSKTTHAALPAGSEIEPLLGHGFDGAIVDGSHLELAGFGAFFASLKTLRN